jgi:archaemetzincin
LAEGLTIWWIGERPPEPALLETVRRALEREFARPVTLLDRPERPVGSFDTRRGQHSSSRILRFLAENGPVGEGKLLGLTDVDLFIPILTFVFGEAQLGGRFAVVSTARLGDNAELPPDPRRRLGRVVREALHETGHTFGLVHCDRVACVMARAAGLREVEMKSDALCADCRVRLADFERRQQGDSQ